MSNAEQYCLAAADLVSGNRNDQHGDKHENHKNIARLWSAYLDFEISALQAAQMMALLKIARTKTGSYNEDDYIDQIGYAACAGEIAAVDR